MASVEIQCPHCLSLYLRTTKQLNQVVKRSGKWICKSCTTSAKNKSKGKPVGSTRIHNTTGYVLEKTETGWVRQHVFVVEKNIGRSLVGDEVVHHINGIKTDNSIDNLLLMTHSEHSILHNTGRVFSDETRRKIGQSRYNHKGNKNE